MDSQDPRRLVPVASAALERAQDDLALRGDQGISQEQLFLFRVFPEQGAGPVLEGQIVLPDRFARPLEDDEALHQMLELADVAGPVVPSQRCEHGVVELRYRLTVFRGVSVEEQTGER